MFNLRRREEGGSGHTRRAYIRDKLLVREVQEMEQNLPKGCSVYFQDPNKLHEFCLTIQPDEGFWKHGKFKFTVFVPEEYNMTPPKVKCLTKLWHPNISVEGDICLSILRENSIDGLGWVPARQLNDVIWGLNSLFTDLMNPEDPLNRDAAQQYEMNRKDFELKVRDYIQRYAR